MVGSILPNKMPANGLKFLQTIVSSILPNKMPTNKPGPDLVD